MKNVKPSFYTENKSALAKAWEGFTAAHPELRKEKQFTHYNQLLTAKGGK